MEDEIWGALRRRYNARPRREVIKGEPAATPDEAAEAMTSCPYWNGKKSLSEPPSPHPELNALLPPLRRTD